jgi:hypothetical protein
MKRNAPLLDLRLRTKVCLDNLGIDHSLTRAIELKMAAERVGVDNTFIGEVDNWNGVDTFDDDGGSEDEDAMDEDLIPSPPQWVKDMYNDAAPTMKGLIESPDNPELIKELSEANNKIREGNDKANAQNDNPTNPAQWTIEYSFLGPHYKIVHDHARVVVQNGPHSGTARESLEKEIVLIEDYLRKNHYPLDWRLPSADQWIEHTTRKLAEEEGRKLLTPGGGDYPWPTCTTKDGDVIIGVRKLGKGTQVCIERSKDGRTIRRLESASKAALSDEVEEYRAIKGFKDLNTTGKYSSKFRHAFAKLL